MVAGIYATNRRNARVERTTTVGVFLLAILWTRIGWCATVHADVQAPIDDAWKRATQAMVLVGMTITVNDRADGIIQATGSFDGNNYFVCPRGRGRPYKNAYSISMTLNSNGPTSTSINVSVVGKSTWWLKRRVLFIRFGHVFTDYSCESTGKLESALLQQIAGT